MLIQQNGDEWFNPEYVVWVEVVSHVGPFYQARMLNDDMLQLDEKAFDELQKYWKKRGKYETTRRVNPVRKRDED